MPQSIGAEKSFLVAHNANCHGGRFPAGRLGSNEGALFLSASRG
jgi:hypothetical protein